MNLKKSDKILSRKTTINQYSLFRQARSPLRLSQRVLINHLTQHHVEQYLKIIKKLQYHKGAKETIKYLKNYQLYVRQWTLDINPEALPWHAVDNTGFPRALRPWKDLICSSNHQIKREVNTLFGAVKLLKVSPVPRTRTITSPFEGRSNFLSKFTDFCFKWKGPAKYIKLSPLDGIPLRSTKGPNGPAVYSCLQDLSALKDRPELYQNIKSLMRITAPAVERLMTTKISQAVEKKEAVHSKLRFLSESAGKTRVVAIADYWSQMALLPVHDLFIASLRRIDTDCTYRHGHLVSTIKKLTSNGTWLGTIDTTAFTDRFPIGPQSAIVNRVLGSEVSLHWTHILTERDFHLKGSNRETDSVVRYKVGQPIGMYRSWAVCVTTLHALIKYRSQKVGKTRFRDYLVLGDDIIIADKEVYNEVLKNLSLLGVETNPNKSTQSDCRAEIAKQFFWKGHNVTGFPLSLLTEVRRNPTQVLELLRNIELLEFNKISVNLVLSMFPKRLHAKVAKLLSSPKPWGCPQVLDWSAPSKEEGILICQAWNWSEKDILKAYKYAQYDIFFKEIEKLKTSLNSMDYTEDSTASSGLDEDHPLIYGLSDRLISCTEVLKKLTNVGMIDEEPVSDIEIMNLAFPPKHDVYTQGSLKKRRITFTGHTLLLALSRLMNNDFSLPAGLDSIDFLFEVFFRSATPNR